MAKNSESGGVLNRISHDFPLHRAVLQQFSWVNPIHQEKSVATLCAYLVAFLTNFIPTKGANTVPTESSNPALGFIGNGVIHSYPAICS